MYTVNGWGAALYGSAHRQEIDSQSTAFAQSNGLPPYSFQAVKWFTAAFLPIVPLGLYRVIKVKRGSFLFGSAEYVMDPVPWDWRQVITHYVVGWSLPLAMIGTIFGLETLDQHLIGRGITNAPFAPFAFLNLVVCGISFLVWWATRPPTMRNVAPAPPARPPRPPQPPQPPQHGSLVPPSAAELPRVPPIRTSIESPFAAEPARSPNLSRRLVVVTLTLIALFASSVVVLGCAGGAFLVWRTVARERANEQALRDARAGQRVGPDTRLAKGTRLQAHRGQWMDVKVTHNSEFGMVRVEWLGTRGPSFMPRHQLRWPVAPKTGPGSG